MNKINILITVFLLSLTFVSYANSKQLSYFNELAQDFLQSNVENGVVDYENILNYPEQLKSLEKMIATIDLGELKEKELLPFYINAYNILIIKTVIDHYPLSNVMENEGFFETNYVVGEIEMTLNGLEKEYIFKKYNNAMVHFGLVCAANGCPILANKAFTAENMNEILRENAKLYLSKKENLSIAGNTIKISSLFNWYQDDFGRKNGIVELINTFSNQVATSDMEFIYTDYDWSLNGK